jgi:GNAT superfamily N-acetyltransferase
MTATTPDRAMIRTLKASELAMLGDCARDFYAASRWLGRFNPERFRAAWTLLFDSGAAVIFVAEDSGGAIAGTLGGIIHREIYGDRLIAEEFFWFARPGHRGAGVALYRAFEEWARARGAAALQMVHLFDVMPEKVARFYLRSGFEPVEMRYQKELT